MDPEPYLALAKRNGITTPYKTADELRQRLRDAHDMPGFIVIYEELIAAARTERDFHDLALTYFRRARAQGVVYVEMFFDPQLHMERGVPLATLYAGLERARRDARSQLGLEAHFIPSFQRDRPAGDAKRVLEASRPWLNRLIERNSFIAAWMPGQRRAVYLTAVDDYVRRFPAPAISAPPASPASATVPPG